MPINWKRLKQMAIVTTCVIIAIYAIEYGICLLTGGSFKGPSTSALIAVIVAANVGSFRRNKNQNPEK